MSVSRDRRFQTQLELRQLLPEIIELILLGLDPLALQRIAATCRDIREVRYSEGFEFAMQLKYRCDEAWVPVALNGGVSLFITETGLMHCGADPKIRFPWIDPNEYLTEYHTNPVNVSGTDGIRFRCVSSCWGFYAAVSTGGTPCAFGFRWRKARLSCHRRRRCLQLGKQLSRSMWSRQIVNRKLSFPATGGSVH